MQSLNKATCQTLALNLLSLLDKGRHVVLLVMRLWMAKIFWQSGMVKISDWQNTLYLFKEEYKVPLLPPELAAYFGTGFELICPVLLVLGLGTRLATLPLLAMTAVIQFTYDQNIEHAYWALLLAILLTIGAGKISADYILRRKFL
jgi:putative oxidoreductase